MVNLTRAAYPAQCSEPLARRLTIPGAYPYPCPFRASKRPLHPFAGRILRTPQALPARPENSAAGF